MADADVSPVMLSNIFASAKSQYASAIRNVCTVKHIRPRSIARQWVLATCRYVVASRPASPRFEGPRSSGCLRKDCGEISGADLGLADGGLRDLGTRCRWVTALFLTVCAYFVPDRKSI